METIANLSLFLLSTIFISLSGVMMPGPVFAVTLAKGYREKNSGALIALGHGVIELPLMIVIWIGFGHFFTLSIIRTSVGLIGGLILIYEGIEMFKAKGKTMRVDNKDIKYGSLIAGIVNTGANPYFFIWWATVGATLIMSAKTFGNIGFLLFVITHWMCDFFWDLFVSMTVFRSRSLWNKRIHEIVFGFGSMVLIGFGSWFIISVLI